MPPASYLRGSLGAAITVMGLFCILSATLPVGEAQGLSTAGMVQWSWGPNPSNSQEFQFSGTYLNGTTVFLTLGWQPLTNTSYVSSVATKARSCNGENILTNGGFETGDMTGWDSGWWNVSLCTGTTCANRRHRPKSGTYALMANGTDFQFSQTVDVSGYPLDAQIELFGWSYHGTISDTLVANLEFLQSDKTTVIGNATTLTRNSPLRPMIFLFTFEIDDFGNEFIDRGYQLDDLTYYTSISGSSANMYGLEARPVLPGKTYTPVGLAQYALAGMPGATNTYPLGTTFGARLNNGGFNCANTPNCWSIGFAFRPTSTGTRATLIQTYSSSGSTANRLTIWYDPGPTTGSLVVQWIANGNISTSTVPGITVDDWWLLHLRTRGATPPFQLYLTQGTAFSTTTPNVTFSTLPSSVIMDTLLIGQDISGTRGLQDNQIDLIGLVEEPASSGDRSAWKTAIDTQISTSSSGYTFGFRRWNLFGTRPSNAKFARARFTFSDTNPNSITWLTMDNFGLRCSGSPP